MFSTSTITPCIRLGALHAFAQHLDRSPVLPLTSLTHRRYARVPHSLNVADYDTSPTIWTVLREPTAASLQVAIVDRTAFTSHTSVLIRLYFVSRDAKRLASRTLQKSWRSHATALNVSYGRLSTPTFLPIPKPQTFLRLDRRQALPAAIATRLPQFQLPRPPP